MEDVSGLIVIRRGARYSGFGYRLRGDGCRVSGWQLAVPGSGY
jgi:hypothetical protein